MRVSPDQVLIVEGIHGLNPMLTEAVPREEKFLIYLSALTQLGIDDSHSVSTTDNRLIRRIVRDHLFRGHPAIRTLELWQSVRRGEERWIFPFQENADVIFNSSTLYELAVLKNHIYPLLTAVEPEQTCYEAVRVMVKILNYVQAAQVEDEIPPTSLVREFIGGNSFYR